MLINIIGAGRVGQTLAHLWVKHALVRVAGVINRSRENALRAIEFIGDGRYVARIEALPSATLTLITTPDACIAEVVTALAANPHLVAGSVVAHCSGVLSSDSLSALKTLGCVVASAHPMRSFSRPIDSVAAFNPTYGVLEGDAAAVTLLASLFASIGGMLSPIDKVNKPLYHAGAVFASNYVLTVLEQARYCLSAAGVDETLIMPMIMQLTQSTVLNVGHAESLTHALTGPLQRGDIETVQQHLDVLIGHQPQSLYALLGRRLLPLTQLDDVKKHALEKILV